jgi:MoxR-like ATPase
MQEHRVTAGGQGYALSEPFFVLATQNPIEQEGTYPLPEAQLDRFMLNLWLDYPSFEDEVQIVRTTTSAYEASVTPVISGDELLEFQDIVRKVPVADNVIEFAVRLASSSRPGETDSPDFVSEYVSWGAGPRASQFLILAAKAVALLRGRATPLIDDVVHVSLPVLRHRIVLNFNADAEGVRPADLIQRLTDETPR